MDSLLADDVTNLKLVQLRSALERRGLTIEGSKSELIDRLQAALRHEAAAVLSKPLKRARVDSQSDSTEVPRRGAAGRSSGTDSPDDDIGPSVPHSATVAEDEDDDVGPKVPEGLAKNDSDEDDDIGPAVPLELGGVAETASSAEGSSPPSEAAQQNAALKEAVRRRALRDEHAYLEALPSAAMYERSYMHRATLTHVVTTPGTDFIVTASADGVIKFWKKLPGEIEFVKTYRAHLGPVVGLAASHDGLRLASIGEDRSLKVFDVLNFDLTDMTALPFLPAAVCWAYPRGALQPLVAVSDRHSGAVHMYNGDRPTEGPVGKVSVHTSPVLALSYNVRFHCVVSADAKGVIDVWSADPAHGFGAPLPSAGLTYEFKSETDLYDVAKARAVPLSLAVAPTGLTFAVLASDHKVRLFRFRSGKLLRAYSEAPELAEQALRDGKLSLDPLDLGKRLATERDLQATMLASLKAFVAPPPPPASATAATSASSAAAAPSAKASASSSAAGSGGALDAASRPSQPTVLFDESGNFLIYPTPLGIKMVNTVTNRVCAVLGKVENTERFTAMALYQGVPAISSQYALQRAQAAGQAGPIMSQQQVPAAAGGPAGSGGGGAHRADPTIITAAFKRNRFFLFSRREPAEMMAESKDTGTGAGSAGRDVFNEPPSKEDLALAAEASAVLARAKLGSEAIVHTTKGDVHLRLMPEIAPKAVENFSGHARSGYYDSLLFHRVIKGFMLQTGDPNGDGTGGSSIWGTEFEDEIERSVRFDRPGVLAMANAGPCTNGSQFFITCAPCAWLDGKHTIFGRVTRGMDVVRAIETTKTDKHDHPLDEVKILSIDVK